MHIYIHTHICMYVGVGLITAPSIGEIWDQYYIEFRGLPIYVYIYVYIYICIYAYVYIYMCINTYTYVIYMSGKREICIHRCVCIHTYIERERERDFYIYIPIRMYYICNMYM